MSRLLALKLVLAGLACAVAFASAKELEMRYEGLSESPGALLGQELLVDTGESMRMLQSNEEWEASATPKDKNGKTCRNGTVPDASGTCVDGFQIHYCKFVRRGAFQAQRYFYYGRFLVVRLPALEDAIRPKPGEVSLNGNCENMVDSKCDIITRWDCRSCCYMSQSPFTLKGVPCLKNPATQCSLNYAQFSAVCGQPPAGTADTTVCRVCYRG